MTLDLKDRLYTSSEVAEILGVSLRSVYRYIEEGKLDADIKTATGRHRFSRKNILDFLRPGDIQNSDNNQPQDYFSNNSNNFSINQTSNPFTSTQTQNQTQNLSSTDNKDDFDFDFNFDDEFLRNLDTDLKTKEDNQFNLQGSSNNNFNNDFGIGNNDFQAKTNLDQNDFNDLDDLEKLLKEFEEEESRKVNDFKSEDMAPNEPVNNYGKSTKYEDNDDDLSLDEILKSFEAEERRSPEPSPISTPVDNKLKNDDFDFDFDDLDNFFDEKSNKPSQNTNSYSNSSNFYNDTKPTETKVESEEDNWLERFRKAASKNSQPEASQSMSSSNLNSQKQNSYQEDNYFNQSESFLSQKKTAPEVENYSDTKEMYYTSSLNDLREIAQQVDKIAKKFDTDYAFTLNAGLSLHKKIDPFNIIHLYVRDRDLELFEDYLDLTPSNKNDASVCLMVTKDGNVFEDSYELHGLYVVSNVQLRSDLIDKGLDRLAREI